MLGDACVPVFGGHAGITAGLLGQGWSPWHPGNGKAPCSLRRAGWHEGRDAQKTV